MNDRTEDENMGSSLWQSQTLDSPRISLAYVHHQAQKLDAEQRRELLGVYAMLAANLLLLVYAFVKSAEFASAAFVLGLRLGVLLLVVGAVWLVMKLHRNRRPMRLDSTVVQSLDAYRVELERRRRYYMRALWVSLWAMAPALVVIFACGILYDERPGKLLRYGLSAAFVAITLPICAMVARRKGKDVQRELDALATMNPK